MSARVHMRNLAFNWGGHAATLVVMFFLSPYVVGELDAVTYGIWSLLNVLTGYMGIFDIGVRASVGRHVALYLGKKDPVGVDETIRAGFGFFSIAGGLILLVGILLGWLFPFLFKGVNPEHYDTVRYLLPLMVVNVWLSAVAAIYSSVLAAHDRFDVARGVDMVVLLVRTVATVYVLEQGWGLWGLVVAVIAGNVCAVIGNRIYAGRVHAGLRSFPLLYTKKRLEELLNYGVAAFVSKSAVNIIGQSDLVIVGMFLSVASVREYSIGAMLVYYSSVFIGHIGKTLFPTVQRLSSSGMFDDVAKIYIKQVKLAIFIGTPIYIGFIFFSKPFINLWMYSDTFGKESVAMSAAVMAVLSCANIFYLFVVGSREVLEANGFVRLSAKNSLYEALLNVAISLLLITVFDLGLLGVALGTLFARIIVRTYFLPKYACRFLKIKFSVYFKEILFPSLIHISIFVLLCLCVRYFLYVQTWYSFVGQVFVLLLVYVCYSYLFFFRKEMRICFSARK